MHPLDAIGNPIRRAILKSLQAGPLSVNEIAGRFPVSRPAISRHLRILMEGGLVEPHSQGKRNCYAIRLKGFQPARKFLDEFWDAALARLEELSKQ